MVAEPLGVGGLEADAAFPFRVQESFECFRQFLAPHLVGVVGHDKDVEAVRHPQPVRGHGRGGQIGDVGAVELGEQFLAGEHFELGAVGLDEVER